MLGTNSSVLTCDPMWSADSPITGYGDRLHFGRLGQEERISVKRTPGIAARQVRSGQTCAIVLGFIAVTNTVVPGTAGLIRPFLAGSTLWKGMSPGPGASPRKRWPDSLTEWTFRRLIAYGPRGVKAG